MKIRFLCRSKYSDSDLLTFYFSSFKACETEKMKYDDFIRKLQGLIHG